MRILFLPIFLIALALLGGCSGEQETLTQFLDNAFEVKVARSPMWQTRLGQKTSYAEWDDISDENFLEEARLARETLKEMRSRFDYKSLTPSEKISYRLYEYEVNRQQEQAKYVKYSYPVNQMYGWQSEIASFLFNQHRVDSLADAEAYLARMRAIPALMDQVIRKLDDREAAGIMAPKFVYPLVLEDCKNLIADIPAQEGNMNDLPDSAVEKINPFLRDLYQKINAVKSIREQDRIRLKELSRYVMMSEVRPAYEKLIARLKQLETKATDDAGVWKLPDGANFYATVCRHHTTTNLTPEQIHQIGLQEVTRIQAEMDTLIHAQLGYKGTLQQFFEKMRRDTVQYYPNTPEGKIRYLNEATAIIADMRGKLDKLFITKPKAPIEVKAVEAYRERSAGKAFYEMGSPDGKRPGYYYANLFNMKNMPRYQMRALAYHEGIPGHHMQLSIAQEMEALPKFRRYADFNAYQEGWGLYCEFIPKELGLYPDPFSDFGRLAMELFRAARLVVDTGIHAKKWTREQATAYYVANTPNAETDCARMVDRHIVMAGQATAYKIGMNKLLELRARAQQQLGSRYDVRKYHEVVLEQGALPLDLLDEIVNQWIAGGGQ